jgi:hypothetical protein
MLGGLGLAIFVLPAVLVGNPGLSGTDLARADSDARGNLISAWSSLALILAAVGTYLTYRLSRRGQVTDRFGKAIDQLGSQSVAVQTGGLYALEQIVKDSRELQWPVMEAIFAYLSASAPGRRETDHPWYEGLDGDELRRRVKQLVLASNVQAAITIIGRRDPRYDQKAGVLNLKGLDLGDARLDHARLAVRWPLLSKVTLRYSHLAGAHLRWAELNSADLTGAVLCDADLEGANLTGARLEGCDLRFANLKDVTLKNANLEGANLTGVGGLGSAQLVGVRWDAETRWPDGVVPPITSAEVNRSALAANSPTERLP